MKDGKIHVGQKIPPQMVLLTIVWTRKILIKTATLLIKTATLLIKTATLLIKTATLLIKTATLLIKTATIFKMTKQYHDQTDTIPTIVKNVKRNYRLNKLTLGIDQFVVVLG
jgi:hypothetical protein